MATTATNSAGARAQSRRSGHDENPVAVLELRVKEILAPGVAGETKAVRLMKLSEAITKYVARLNVHLASASLDGWSARRANRFRIYLCQLGDDVRRLASTARSKPMNTAKDAVVQTQRGNS